jgi:hypothetical protein
LLLSKLIELKDKLNMSYKDYNTIRKELCPHWPSEYFIKKVFEKLDDGLFEILRNQFGCFVKCNLKITHYIQKHFNEMTIKDKMIRIKLVGDGTITGPLTILYLGFTLPDLGTVAKTATGNFQLGCFEITSENYETLKFCLYTFSTKRNT